MIIYLYLICIHFGSLTLRNFIFLHNFIICISISFLFSYYFSIDISLVSEMQIIINKNLKSINPTKCIIIK